MPVSDAKEMILRTSAKELLKHRPSWLKDCVRISLKQTGFLDTNVRNPRFYNRWNHPHFPTRKCPSEVARQGKYNV